jgi:glycosyltransferase involved in cell wall biosynthesis
MGEMETRKPDISIVVPAFNEEKLLPRLLASVHAARERYRGGAGAIEVIVADNASTDRTAEIAREAGCGVARVEKRRIGAVRNGGAAIARGRILAFTDADTIVHPETFNAIADVMDTGHYIGGGTGWKMERDSLGLRATCFVARTLVHAFGVEGGVQFCRRDAFDAVGGYNSDKDVAEDVELLRALRAYGRRNGLRFKIGIPAAVTTVSTRKFDEHGDWHMFTMALWPLLKWKTMRQIVDDYWYPQQRR